MTLQESNEIGWFDISNPPQVLENKIAFTNPEHEPDGIWVNGDGTLICTAGEYDGTIGVHTLDASGKPTTQKFIKLANDLPSNWDWDDKRKGIEPEEVVIVEAGDKAFALATLQES